jgi:hypothetical protein
MRTQHAVVLRVGLALVAAGSGTTLPAGSVGEGGVER